MKDVHSDTNSLSESKSETHLNGLTVIQQSNSSISQTRSMDSSYRARRSFSKPDDVPLLEVPERKRKTVFPITSKGVVNDI